MRKWVLLTVVAVALVDFSVSFRKMMSPDRIGRGWMM